MSPHPPGFPIGRCGTRARSLPRARRTVKAFRLPPTWPRMNVITAVLTIAKLISSFLPTRPTIRRQMYICIYLPYICMYVYMCIWIYVYVYTRMYVCMYVYIHTCIYVYMSVCQNFLFMARPWMIWGGGVLSLYKDSVTCCCEVSLCSCESKKTIKLTDPTRSLPCPLLPSAALYFTALYCLLLSFTCPLLPCTALHCLLLPFTCPLRPFTALYCPSLPFTALYCPLLHGAVAHKTIW